MTDKNWVYLPESGTYLNLNHVSSVQEAPSSEVVWFNIVFEDQTRTAYGEDAKILVEALRGKQ